MLTSAREWAWAAALVACVLTPPRATAFSVPASHRAVPLSWSCRDLCRLPSPRQRAILATPALVLIAQVKDEGGATPKADTTEQVKATVPASVSSAASVNPVSIAKNNYDTMGKFMEKLDEYKALPKADKDGRKAMQAEIIEMYVEFAVPAVSLALGTFVAFPGAFAVFFTALAVTGRGLPDVQALFASAPDFIADPAANLLDKVDPTLGNAAVAAILVELVSPLLFVSQLALKGKIEPWLRGKLEDWGLDAKGLLARLERIAGPDEDLF